MKDIVIAKVETDPLIHYGGLFNTIGCQFLLSVFSLLLFIPFIRDGRYKNFMLFIFTILPILNIYYRNTHQFVGGVFLGHLLFVLGILVAIYLAASGFETGRSRGRSREMSQRLLFYLVIIAFLVRAVLAFGARPTDSGIFSGTGGILYLTGSSPFRDYWGVVSIGSRYGPALYLAYLPFVPIAYLTKHLLWGEALSQWNSIRDPSLAIATSYTGAIFYEALIILILMKSFKRWGRYAALIYLTNPLNAIGLSVNANELPQTAFFLLGIYLLKRPLLSALSFTFSSMMKIYPLLGAIPFFLQYRASLAKRFLSAGSVFTLLFGCYWLYEASLAPETLKTNPLRDIFLYQSAPGRSHSIWYFVDNLIIKDLSLIIVAVILLLIVYLIYRIVKWRKRGLYSSLCISILLFCGVTIINQSVHPGYYYFIQTLLYYLFFLRQEEDTDHT